MSKFLLIAAVAVAGAAAAGWAIFSRPAEGPSLVGVSVLNDDHAPDQPSSGETLVTIKSIMEHPREHAGIVRLEGVVVQVDRERGLFMLMSREDWAACGKSHCCVPLMLPVRGSDAPPAKETVVRVEGRIEQSDGKYVLEVDSLDRLEG